MAVVSFGCLALLLTMGLSPAEVSKSETVTLSGKVVELAAALRAAGLTVDADPIAKQVALQAKDHSLTPLLSDDASRALFLDERLRNRPVEIKARRFAGIPYLQVLTVRIEEDGTLRTPEYYCEICTISVRYPQICPCCQGPMVLRMMPETR
jgi:hypothetical protein